MKTLFLLPLLLLFVSLPQNPAASENSGLTVVGYKCAKARQNVKEPPPPSTIVTPPAAAVTAQNKNFQRNARVNDPAGVRDPNGDTIDGRSAALEKMIQDSRAPAVKTSGSFAYSIKVHNDSTRAVEVLFWEYQFTDPMNAANVTRRQFLCGVNIKPNKDKEVQAFTLLGPGDVVSAQSIANAPGSSPEKVIINRVEYADGTIWQRKDWSFAEIKLTFEHAIATPWAAGEMCRGL